MNEPNLGAEFLQKKYRLNSEQGSKIIGQRKKIPEYDYTNRITTYLKWLDQRDPEQLKESLHKQLIIKTNEIPEAYFESAERKHLEEGRGHIKLPEAVRLELAKTIIEDQKKSLDRWVDYLICDEVKIYPEWLRYFVFRSIANMGRYDKSKKLFTERTGGATAPFPDLNHEALNVILRDLVITYGSKEEKSKMGIDEKTTALQFTGRYDISQDSKNKYNKYVDSSNFEKLYALTLEEYKPIADELLRITEGQWKLYPKGSDPKLLVNSIAPYGTGWCLRGEGMARQYLHGSENIQPSDLHIFYSKDKEGKFTIPRVVIVVRDNKIDEVRGVWPGENLDPYIGTIVDAKLNEHPDGARYKKKSADMRKLTEIYYKVYPKKAFSEKDQRRKDAIPKSLDREDLIFLYQLDSLIQGFGLNNQEDPRITELRSTRNPEEDMPIVFDCKKSQIAKDAGEIRQDTKAYVGKLTPGIFDLLSKYNIKHIYTSFPEGRIRKESLLIGGKTAKQLETLFTEQGIRINQYVQDMLRSKDFQPIKIPETITTIRLKIEDLGFTNNPTTIELSKRVKTFGLELCPAETGLHMRLVDRRKWCYVATEQITGSDGDPSVFGLDRFGDALWVTATGPGPRDWDLGCEFFFRLRK